MRKGRRKKKRATRMCVLRQRDMRAQEDLGDLEGRNWLIWQRSAALQPGCDVYWSHVVEYFGLKPERGQEYRRTI
jgi:hypothetical protein